MTNRIDSPKIIKAWWQGFFLLLLVCVPAARLRAQQNLQTLGMGFSALVRDSTGKAQPLKPVQLRFTVVPGGQIGSANAGTWVEIQKTVTDSFGFANATVGAGVKAGGTADVFGHVDFSQTNYWLIAEVLNPATQVYQVLTEQALQAVPYAKAAGAAAGQSVAPGTICAFGGDFNHVPAGWIECQGQQLDNTNNTYTALFNAIGYAWGGQGNIFYAPGTGDLFLRGANNGKGADPDAAHRIPKNGRFTSWVGSWQPTSMQGHLAGIWYGFSLNPGAMPNIITGSSTGFNLIDNIAPLTYTFGYATSSLPGSQTPRTSANDNHPVNVLVNYIIKL